jgi:hypothetical protein
MTRDTTFENPLEQAMQRGTLGGPKEQTSLSKVQDRKTSKSHAVTPSHEHAAAAGKKQQTVYLPPQVIRAVKHTAVDQDMDISSVVQTALEQYIERLNITY